MAVELSNKSRFAHPTIINDSEGTLFVSPFPRIWHRVDFGLMNIMDLAVSGWNMYAKVIV